MRFVFITLSTLLFIFFFAPWINLQEDLGFTFSGASISFNMDELEHLKQYLSVDDLSFLKISYLLYIIPISSIIHIISNLLNRKGWYLRLDYVLSLVSLTIMYKVVLYLNLMGNNYLSWGYYACLYATMMGIVLQAAFFLYSKRRRL